MMHIRRMQREVERAADITEASWHGRARKDQLPVMSVGGVKLVLPRRKPQKKRLIQARGH